MLHNKKLHQLLLGASWLSCGGGLSYQEQVKNYQHLVKKQSDFKLNFIDVNQLPQDGFLTVCGEAGPTHLPPLEKELAGKLVAILEKHSGKKINGLLPLEIGQEMILMETSHYTKLPVVDADLAGGRAVPMIYLTLPFLLGYQLDLSPVVAINKQGKIKLLKHAKNLDSIDNFLDQFSQESHGIVFFLSGALPLKKVKKFVNLGSYTKIGNLKKVNQGLFKIVKLEKLQRQISLIQKIILKNNQSELTIFSQNEYLAVLDNLSQKIIYQAPQIICLSDQSGQHGINNGDLKVGMKVNLMVIEPTGLLAKSTVKNKWYKYVNKLITSL